MTKPPIGLTNRKFYEEFKNKERLTEVMGAISRYYEALLKIPIEWVEEYNELIDKCKEYVKEN